MRMGVLDIGSNTGHLLVMDAYRGAPPMPAYSYKETLLLAERLDASGAVAEDGIAALLRFMVQARTIAEDKGCSTVIAFATSAIRDSVNADEVLDRAQQESGTALEVLAGDAEARLTFLAVRRWFGWSSGRLGVFDIGGGSLEIATGSDETPEAAQSLPLGAGRLTRDWKVADAPDDQTLGALRTFVRSTIANDAGPLLRGGAFDHAVATSKTFRSLARICGAAAPEEGVFVRRALRRVDLARRLDELRTMPLSAIVALPGVPADRAHQLLAGAADAVMDLFSLPQLEICPWALREGVLLERLDLL